MSGVPPIVDAVPTAVLEAGIADALASGSAPKLIARTLISINVTLVNFLGIGMIIIQRLGIVYIYSTTEMNNEIADFRTVAF